MSRAKVGVATLVRAGACVLPAGRGDSGKAPAVNSWTEWQRKRPSASQLKEWAETKPPAWGVVTGEVSGVFVLDFDGAEGRALCDELGLKPHVLTPSGGNHVYVAHPMDRAIATRTRVLPHTDVRADGGFALAVGPGRRWVRPYKPMPFGALPERVREALGAPPSGNGHLPASIPQGARNDTIFRSLAGLRAKGATDPELAAAADVLNGRTEQPLDDRELGRIIASAGKYEPDDDWSSLPLTDAGNAKRLAMDNVGRLIFVPGLGWHEWTEQRWRSNDDGAEIRAALAVAQRLREESVHLPREKAEQMFKAAMRAESRTRLEAVAALARTDQALLARPDELDADAFAFNVANGTMDLSTGELRPHDPADLLTKVATVAFDPEATCPRWDKATDEWFGGDEDLKRLVAAVFGYSLTGDIREQVLFMLQGEGEDGKSVCVETFAGLMGPYAVRADASTFTTNHRRGVRSDLARLRAARFVPGVEIEAGARLAEVLVKQATGGDTIVASHLYREEFEFKPEFKLFLVVNKLPEIREHGHAIWRRIRVIPFSGRIAKPDRNLAAKLEDERSGILNWALRGCADWQRHGLPSASVVERATATYRQDMDPLREFLADCCARGDGKRYPKGDLYDLYLWWAAREQVARKLDKPDFDQRVGSLPGVTADRRRMDGRPQRIWSGIEPKRSVWP